MAVADDASIASDTSYYSHIPVSSICCSSSDDDNEQLPSPDSHVHVGHSNHSGNEWFHLRYLRKT